MHDLGICVPDRGYRQHFQVTSSSTLTRTLQVVSPEVEEGVLWVEPRCSFVQPKGVASLTAHLCLSFSFFDRHPEYVQPLPPAIAKTNLKSVAFKIPIQIRASDQILCAETAITGVNEIDRNANRVGPFCACSWRAQRIKASTSSGGANGSFGCAPHKTWKMRIVLGCERGSNKWYLAFCDEDFFRAGVLTELHLRLSRTTLSFGTSENTIRRTQLIKVHNPSLLIASFGFRSSDRALRVLEPPHFSDLSGGMNSQITNSKDNQPRAAGIPSAAFPRDANSDAVFFQPLFFQERNHMPKVVLWVCRISFGRLPRHTDTASLFGPSAASGDG